MKHMLLTLGIAFGCLAADVAQEDQWDNQLYDANSQNQYEAGLKHLQAFNLENAYEIKTILELGCNTARISRDLAPLYPDKQFIGIDPEQSAIEWAKQHNKAENLTLICETTQSVNLQSHALPLADLVACYQVLLLIERDELPQVFQNIARNMAPGGILDMSTSAKQKDTPLATSIYWTLAKPTWWSSLWTCLKEVWKGQGNKTLLTVQELKTFAENANLTVDICEERDAQFTFKSREEMSSWLQTILRPVGTKKLSEEKQKLLAKESVDTYCDSYCPPKDDGTIEYCFKLVHLTAHKPVNEYQ